MTPPSALPAEPELTDRRPAWRVGGGHRPGHRHRGRAWRLSDPRLPHLRAAVGSSRFDDALQVLGRLGGPPSCAAAALVEGGSGVRIVVAKQAHAEARVAGRTVEIRPQPPGDWAQVLLHDVESVLLIPGLGNVGPGGKSGLGMPSAAPSAAVPSGRVHPDVLAKRPVPESVRMVAPSRPAATDLRRQARAAASPLVAPAPAARPRLRLPPTQSVPAPPSRRGELT